MATVLPHEPQYHENQKKTYQKCKFTVECTVETNISSREIPLGGDENAK